MGLVVRVHQNIHAVQFRRRGNELPAAGSPTLGSLLFCCQGPTWQHFRCIPGQIQRDYITFRSNEVIRFANVSRPLDQPFLIGVKKFCYRPPGFLAGAVQGNDLNGAVTAQ